MCLCECLSCIYRCLWRPEEVAISPEAGVIECCEMPHGDLEAKLRSSRKSKKCF